MFLKNKQQNKIKKLVNKQQNNQSQSNKFQIKKKLSYLIKKDLQLQNQNYHKIYLKGKQNKVQ